MVPAPGRRIARGRSADVYALGRDRVLRRYRDPAADCAAEAEVMRYAAARGYPVPTVHDAEGPDLVLELVRGPTMLADLGRRPWRLWRHAATLASLHDSLHAIAAPSWARPSGWTGDRLLHLDLHPDNVVLTTKGPVVIDWPNARRGPAELDVAYTWMVLAAATPDRRSVALLGRVARGAFTRAFLANFDREAAAGCLPGLSRSALLVRRNFDEREQAALDRLVERTLASPGS